LRSTVRCLWFWTTITDSTVPYWTSLRRSAALTAVRLARCLPTCAHRLQLFKLLRLTPRYSLRFAHHRVRGCYACLPLPHRCVLVAANYFRLLLHALRTAQRFISLCSSSSLERVYFSRLAFAGFRQFIVSRSSTPLFGLRLLRCVSVAAHSARLQLLHHVLKQHVAALRLRCALILALLFTFRSPA